MSGYTDLTKMENSRNCLRRIARHEDQQFSKNSIVNVMERFVETVNIMDDTILVPCRLMDAQVGDSTDIIPAPGKDSTSNQLMLNSSAQGKRGAAQSKNVHEFLSSAELFNLYNMLNSLKNDLLWTGKGNTESEDEEEAAAAATTSSSSSSSTSSAFDDQQQQQQQLSTMTTTATKELDLGMMGSGRLVAPAELKTEIAAAAARGTTATTTPTTTTTAHIATVVKGHNRRPSTASVASTASVSNLSDAESDISNENDSGVEFEGNKSDNAQSSAGSISSSEDLCAAKTKKAANTDKATELAKRCKRHLNGLYLCLEQMTEAANYLTARYQSDIGPV